MGFGGDVEDVDAAVEAVEQDSKDGSVEEEQGDDDDETEDDDVDTEELSSKNFIIVTRCQPGILDWGGRLCRMPAQWKGP